MILSEDEVNKEYKLWENRLIKTCTICNGTGSIPSANNLMKMCECMKKSRINTHLVSHGLPRKYLNEDWNWDRCVNRPFVKKCRDYSDNFMENYFKGKGLFIHGLQGRGKSTMEVLIAKDVIQKINPDTQKNFMVAFSIYDDMVRMSFDNTRKHILERMYKVPQLLIIDNIGSEVGLTSENRTSVRLLENILRTRDNAGYPTIISSNFPPDDLKKIYSDIVHDFVKMNCDIIDVGRGENLRKDTNEEKLEL